MASLTGGEKAINVISIHANDDKQTEFEEVIGGVWTDVIDSIQNVLTADKYLGFDNFERYADPSIDEITKSLTAIESSLSVLLSFSSLTLSAENALLNCQQCLHWIRRVFSALKHGNKEEYDDVLQKLKRLHKDR